MNNPNYKPTTSQTGLDIFGMADLNTVQVLIMRAVMRQQHITEDEIIENVQSKAKDKKISKKEIINSFQA